MELTNAEVVSKSYYIFRDPSYSDVCKLCLHIEERIESTVFADGRERTWKVCLLSGVTGEVFADRDEFGLWEIYV